MPDNLFIFFKNFLEYYYNDLIKRNTIPIIYSAFFLLFFVTNIHQLNAEEYSSSPNVKTSKLHINFSFKGANPTSLQSVYHSPISNKKTKACFIKIHELSLIELCIKDNPLLQKKTNQLTYHLEREEGREYTLLKFVSEYISDSIQFEKIYNISKNNYTFTFTLKITGVNADNFLRDNRLEIILRHGNCFIPTPSAGFLGSSEKVKAIVIRNNKAHEIHLNKKQSSIDTLESNQWVGFRNNFWALLCRPLSSNVLLANDNTSSTNTLHITLKPGQRECSFQLFAGPIEHTTLKNEKAQISGLLFSGLWFWMRWLCLGLLFLLNWLIKIIGNHGLAIIMLSVCVKILMLPLVRIADKWQRDVNVQKSTLQPFIDEIKTNYRGEEQNKRILKVHKEQGIHPLYTLKSLLSVMVQIPIFLAAYHMLSENIALSGVSFLWIKDITLTDNLLHLPFRTPFFGEYLNLLPFLMTGITLLASWKFKDNSLSQNLLKKQQQNLYWMALLFFILFYTFPAGMVLYWTTNNLIALIKVLFKNAESKLVPKSDT